MAEKNTVESLQYVGKELNSLASVVIYLQENYPEELAYFVEEVEQLPSIDAYATKVIKPAKYRNVLEDYLL